jgi:poly(A)-specific ribonuclease
MYVARPYNFNVSPLLIHGEKLEIKRDITFQSSAIHFLIKNSFDIGAVFTKGVPYLSREEESIARINYSKKQEMSTNIPDIVISPDDDEALAFYHKAKKTIFDFAKQKKVCLTR